MKKILKELLKVVITGGILYYLFRRIPIGDIISTIKGMEVGYLIGAFFLFFLYYFFFSWRWRYLLESQDIKLTPGRSFLYIHISFFFNNILPSGIGMDAVRSGYAGGKENFEKAFGASLMERVLGMIGMMLIGVFAMFTGNSKFIPFSLIYAGLILVTLGFYFFMVSLKATWLKKKLWSIKLFNLGESLKRFYLAFKTYKEKLNVILQGIIYSVFVQMTIIFINFLLARGLSINISFMSLIAFIPLITIISLIPVTINGLGTREWAYRFLFLEVGVSPEGAVSLSLLFFATSVLASSLGGIAFLFVKRKPKTEPGQIPPESDQNS